MRNAIPFLNVSYVIYGIGIHFPVIQSIRKVSNDILDNPVF